MTDQNPNELSDLIHEAFVDCLVDDLYAKDSEVKELKSQADQMAEALENIASSKCSFCKRKGIAKQALSNYRGKK